MIKSLRKEYFQKSKAFLYPLLNIPRGSPYTPKDTYIAWNEDIYPADKKFLCVYELHANEDFYKFENKHLLGSDMFDNFHLLEDNTGLFVFNYSRFSEDYQKFLLSKYSTMSPETKEIILDFFKSNNKNLSSIHHINSYLYPKMYYGIYADLLGVEKELLMEVVELCPPIDTDKETLKVKKLLDL
jgi:hypothetical protein